MISLEPLTILGCVHIGFIVFKILSRIGSSSKRQSKEFLKHKTKVHTQNARFMTCSARNEYRMNG